MRLFSISGSQTLGLSVANALGREIDPVEERDFEDGEHKIRPLVGVRGEDVFAINSLNGAGGISANDKLCKLLFFIAVCKENGARTVTAITPYLAYSRKDRQTKSRDPVTTRYVAQLFEAVGADRVITVDVHNLAAFQNAFRCETIHLDTRRLFVPIILHMAEGRPVTIFSPDGGGVKRAQLLKELFEAETGSEAGFGFMEKRRSRGVVSGELFAGDVSDTAVFIVDDMIGTGGTMLRGAQACRERGAASVYALAAHGLFGEGAERILDSSEIDRIIVTDSVREAEAARLRAAKGRVEVISLGPLIAETIRRLGEGASISDLVGMED